MPFQAPGSVVPSPGQVLGGKYLIHRLLGEGGMAFVFEASHQRLAQRVAVKLLHPDFSRDAEIVARFEREARALALLRSRHVARVTDVDATLDGLPYIVMEFLQGRDLDAELEERVRLPVEEAVDYVLQACAAMDEAHGAGIVHRDLKPANLFLAEDNGERVVKVLDFGISKVVGESTRLTGLGAVMGTVLYMSPEQVRARPDVDTRADIWSLGVILYELIAGRAPWEGGSQQIAAAIVSADAVDVRTFAPAPDGIASALRTALARDRNRRFGSVRELAHAIAPFAPPGSIGASIADQLVTGQSGRMRPSYASFPGALNSSLGPSLPPVSAPHPSLMLAPPPALAGPPSGDGRMRSFVAIGAVLGVLAAIGIVLMIVAFGARRQIAASAGAPPPSAIVPPLVDPTSASTAAAAGPVPSPPSTGVDEVRPNASTSPSPSPSTRKAEAGPPTAAESASPAASVPPPFL